MLDTYTMPAAEQAALARRAPLAVMHDRGGVPPGTRLVISVGGRPGGGPDGARRLTGLRYAPLRAPFWGVPERATRERVTRVLVTTGDGPLQDAGVDQAAAINAALPDLTVALVRGPYARFDAPPGVELVDVPRSLLHELLAADIVITAAGQIALESAATGAATVALVQAENQRAQASALQQSGAARVPDDLIQAVTGLVHDRAAREALARGPGRRRRLWRTEDRLPSHRPASRLDCRAIVDLNGKTVLVSGATGSFGTAFVRTILARYDLAAVRAFSRDEYKQSVLASAVDDPRLRLLIGDVRDRERLRVATRGVDLIIHAAALKQVPACEYNPFEAVQTNVIGAENIISAAIDNAVPLTVALSTDKAVNPVNLYGATKLCAERIVAQAGVYAGTTDIRFASMRYGNVVGSRGSVIPLFRSQAPTGVLSITDERMTRFWITLEQAVEFVLSCLALVRGGETFVPKIPSMRIVDLARAIAPGAERRIVGIRPGEKLHEVLVTEDEARHTRDLGDRYVIEPERPYWDLERPVRGEPLADGFRYASDANHRWLTAEQLVAIAA